jgi:hypothetical protein
MARKIAFLVSEATGMFGAFTLEGAFVAQDGSVIPGVEITDTYCTQDAVMNVARKDGSLTVYGGSMVSPIRLAAAFATHHAAGHKHGATIAEWVEYTRKDGTRHPLMVNAPADLAERVAAFYGNDED